MGICPPLRNAFRFYRAKRSNMIRFLLSKLFFSTSCVFKKVFMPAPFIKVLPDLLRYWVLSSQVLAKSVLPHFPLVVLPVIGLSVLFLESDDLISKEYHISFHFIYPIRVSKTLKLISILPSVFTGMNQWLKK